MKTAMQKAIEHYESLSAQGSNQAYVIAKFLKEKFLEEEKEQIKNAFYEGMKLQPFDPNLGRAELYYKATYNPLDLKAMEQKLDDALAQETTESLTDWLTRKKGESSFEQCVNCDESKSTHNICMDCIIKMGIQNIQLPTDEQIYSEAEGHSTFSPSYVEGAKYVIEQIKNQKQ